jgi:hypothetical protein
VWVEKSETKAKIAALLKVYKAQEQTRLSAAAASSSGPIHVQGNRVDEADVDRVVSHCRFFGLPRFTGLPAKMKEKLPAYRTTVAMIKPLEERKDAESNEIFDMEAWLKS